MKTRGYPSTSQLNADMENRLVLSWQEISDTVKERKKKMQTYQQHIKEFREKAIRQAAAKTPNFNNYIYGNARKTRNKKSKAGRKGK